jgi:hypothetical protein
VTVIDDKTHTCPLEVSPAAELIHSIRVGTGN